jgi:hypothetical protein
MKEKNQLFISYMGTIEFVGKKVEKDKKDGSGTYWTRSLAVNIHDTSPKYPVTLVFDLMGKKVPLADGLSKGMDVLVKFTINSKSYVTAEGETKYFLSLNLIDVEYEGKPKEQPAGKSSGTKNDYVADAESNDLPF